MRCRILSIFTEPDFEASVFGVCTTDFRARKRSPRLRNPVCRKNEDELIFHPQIDIISICTPNVYYETIKKAIAATKHVYCENRCVTFGQAREVSLLAAKSECARALYSTAGTFRRSSGEELINRANRACTVLFGGISSQQLHKPQKTCWMEAKRGYLRRRSAF